MQKDTGSVLFGICWRFDSNSCVLTKLMFNNNNSGSKSLWTSAIMTKALLPRRVEAQQDNVDRRGCLSCCCCCCWWWCVKRRELLTATNLDYCQDEESFFATVAARDTAVKKRKRRVLPTTTTTTTTMRQLLLLLLLPTRMRMIQIMLFLILVLLSDNDNALVHGFMNPSTITSSNTRSSSATAATARRRISIKPHSLASQFRTTATTTRRMVPLHHLGDFIPQYELWQHPFDVMSHAWQSSSAASFHPQEYVSTAVASSSSWHTTTTTTTISSSLTTAQTEVWSSNLPEIQSVQDLETEMEEQAINLLGRDVLTFLAASVVVVPLARFLKVRRRRRNMNERLTE